MSTRRKGTKNEKEFEELLIRYGYTTQRVKGSIKYNKQVDMFGAWDVLAFDASGWLLVQVKTDYRKKVKEDLMKWCREHKPPQTTAIYVIRKKNKSSGRRWEIVYIYNNRDIPLVLSFKVRE